MITREQLFTRIEAVPVDGFEDHITVRSLPRAEVDALMDDADGDYKLIAATVLGADGEPMFTVEDARGLPGASVIGLTRAVLVFNGYSVRGGPEGNAS